MNALRALAMAEKALELENEKVAKSKKLRYNQINVSGDVLDISINKDDSHLN